MAENQKSEKKAAENPTPGKPCPACGCPYPGDHAIDCPLLPVQELIDPLLKRIERLEKELTALGCKVNIETVFQPFDERR